MTIDNMPLSATQTHAECGVDARTIDDTREGIERNERASVEAWEIFPKSDEAALHRAFGGDVG